MRTAGYKGPDLFSPSALKRIASASLGLTRRINILCDKALLAAFAGNTHQITVAHVKAAIRDAEFRGSSMPRLVYWLGGAAAALLIVGAGVAYYQLNGTSQVDKPAVPAATPPPPAPAPAPAQESPAPPQAASPAADSSPASAEAVAIAPTAQTAPAAPPQATQSQEPPPDNAPAASPSSAAASQKAPAYGKLTRQRLAETRKWLDATADNRWFIQLLSTDAGSASHVEGFLANASKAVDADAIRAYTVESKGVLRLGVIYGEYPSREAATQALNALPAALKIYGPYPRQVRRLRS
jgi:hypothetical protein